MIYRNEFLSLLSQSAAREHLEISNGAESLNINYVPNTPSDLFEDINNLKDRVLENIKRKSEAEKTVGASLVGIHRDDIEFLIDGDDAKIYSSQGQQRTAVISIKSAQTEIIKDILGEYPVLLLDDVMSELDEQRKNFLYKKTSGKQVIITGTEKETGDMSGNKLFKIENGTIREK